MPKSNHSQQRQLEELRVAKQELMSADTTGQVYFRLSKGAVSFLTERSVVAARVDRLIINKVEEIDKLVSESTQRHSTK
jgi:hypothetical protein